MRFPALILIPVLSTAAAAGEEPPSPRPPGPPGLEESRADYLLSGADQEVFVPIRNQYIRPLVSRKLGDWDARFFLSETAVADDNVFLSDRDREFDFVSVATFGTRLTREGASASSEVTAAVTREDYLRNPALGNLSGYSRAGFQWGMRQGFVRVIDEFTRREDAVQFKGSTLGPSPATVGGGDRVSQVSNEAHLTLGFNDDKLAAEIQYGNTYRSFGGPAGALDGMEHRGIALARWRATPKLEVNAMGEVRGLRYLDRIQNDADARAAFAGFRWAASPKTTAYGRAGYLGQSVSSSGKVKDATAFHGPAGSAGIEWEASARVRTDLQYSRDIYPLLGSNFQDTQLLGASVHWEASPRWSVLLKADFQDSRASYTGEMDRGVTALLRVGFRPSDAVEIAFTWDFRARRSGAGDSDFDNNRLGLQITWGF